MGKGKTNICLNILKSNMDKEYCSVILLNNDGGDNKIETFL